MEDKSASIQAAPAAAAAAEARPILWPPRSVWLPLSLSSFITFAFCCWLIVAGGADVQSAWPALAV